MPLIAYFVLLVLAAGLIYRIMHAIAADPSLFTLLCLGVGGAFLVTCLITYAVIRGASRHVVIAYHPREIGTEKMPAPLELPAAGPQMVLIAEREEDDEPEPDPAKPSVPCENGCGQQLGDRVIIVEVLPDGVPDDYQGEKHLFCSQSCADDWQEADIARRAAC